MGLRCDVLNSTVKDRRKDILTAIEQDELDLVLVTPETLFSEDIQSRIRNFRIGLFVIDEAHCISDWGHDFRLEYGNLRNIVEKLPENVPILATTATANNRVVSDLCAQLGNDVFISRGPLTRDSLYIQVLNKPDKIERYAWMLENIPKLPGSGIIYCLTQRDCDYLAEFLNKNCISAAACGMRFNHKVNSSGLKWANPIWACHNQLKNTKKACDNTRIKEDVLCEKFVEAYNHFVTERPISNSLRLMEAKLKNLQEEERDLAGLALKHLIPDTAFRIEQKKLKAEMAELTEAICAQKSKSVTGADFTVITEYDPEKVKKFITKVIVRKGTVTFVFYNGVEITLEYSNGTPGNKPGWNAKEAF